MPKSSIARRQFNADDYTIAWLCALYGSELLAARCMLDEEHKPLQHDPWDSNTYIYGSINGHNVVIACMVAQTPGLVSATTLVKHLESKFRKLEVHIFVGIGGGVPRYPEHDRCDVRLGDVVVGWPDNPGLPPVVGWDHGSFQRVDGRLIHKHLNSAEKPSRELLAILTRLLHQHEATETNFSEHLRRLDLHDDFGHPGRSSDKLYRKDFPCQNQEREDRYSPCSCDSDQLVTQLPLEQPEDSIRFHRGTILSGNTFMNDPHYRDEICEQFEKPLCFEMEAAGIMPDTKAVVIRGICDYTDTHANKRWQKYAAGTAAAFAREFVFQKLQTPGTMAQEVDSRYLFNNLEDRKHLDPGRRVWERMKLSGLTIYEQIYAECKNPRGSVDLDTLKRFLPKEEPELVQWCWMNVARKQPRLHRGMTFAVIYLVHLRYYHNVNKQAIFITPEEDGRKTRGRLRRFAAWVSCNCNDPLCPNLWNFINDSGIRRNCSQTCAAAQYVDRRARNQSHENEQYGEKEWDELYERWETGEGIGEDPVRLQ